MISNTNALYVKVRQFQDERNRLTDIYDAKRKALDRFRGSEGFVTDMKVLNDQFSRDIQTLQETYRPSINTILGGMMEAIGKRSVKPPTNDQLNILSLLKMKKNITEEDIQRTAESVRDNPFAVSIVEDIARDHGIRGSFNEYYDEMPSKIASDTVTSLKAQLDDFLQHNTTKASRLVEKFQIDKYGSFSGQLTRRIPFNSKEEFYKGFGLDEDSLKQFSVIVDA